VKPNIHPQYFDEAKVTCVCGNAFTTGATVPEIHVEICSNCHPFFTGEMKFVDTLGRVERFQQKQKTATKIHEKKVLKVQEKEEKQRPGSLKEMFELVKKQAAS